MMTDMNEIQGLDLWRRTVRGSVFLREFGELIVSAGHASQDA